MQERTPWPDIKTLSANDPWEQEHGEFVSEAFIPYIEHTENTRLDTILNTYGVPVHDPAFVVECKSGMKMGGYVAYVWKKP